MSNLVRHRPSGNLWRISNDYDQKLTDTFHHLRTSLFDNNFLSWPLSLGMPFNDNLSVDMYETTKEVVIKAELPEVRPDDIEVEDRDGWLTIKATSANESEHDRNGWHIRERRNGSWQRTLKLPVEVNSDRADASFDDGVLTVKLPKLNANKPLLNRIPVKWPKLRLPKLGKQEPKIRIKGAN